MHRVTMQTGAIVLFLALAASGCDGDRASADPATFEDGILVDRAGMTLYIFDKDPRGAGTSVCSGTCAQNWPPLLAQPGAEAHGEFSIIRRDDGSSQWAYRGKPLYRWVKDREPGDRTGDNFGNVWHVVEQEAPAMGPEHSGY